MLFSRTFSLFFLPAAARGIVSFAMVPFTTYMLNPADFGIVALVTAVTSLAASMATLGLTFIISGNFQTLEHAERCSMISTVLYATVTVSLGLGALIVAFWPMLPSIDPIYAETGTSAVWLAVAAMVLGTPWVLANDVIVMQRKPGVFALVQLAQVVVNASLVLVGLYVFDWGVIAIFAALVGSAAVTLLGALMVLRSYLVPRIHTRWLLELRKIGPLAMASSLGEGLQTTVERGLLASGLGLSGLGLYAHINQYRSLVHMGVKAGALSLWPTTIEEAREAQRPRFTQTIVMWQFFHVGLTALGLAFACFGADMVALLTHNKFTEGAVLLPYWIVYMLVQSSGKPQTGLLYAHQRGRSLSALMLVSLALWLPTLYVLVPLLGLKGGVIAMIVMITVYRVGAQLLAHQIAPATSGDRYVALGIMLVVAAAEFVAQTAPSLALRAAVLAAGLALLAVVGRRPVRLFLSRSLGISRSVEVPVLGR